MGPDFAKASSGKQARGGLGAELIQLRGQGILRFVVAAPVGRGAVDSMAGPIGTGYRKSKSAPDFAKASSGKQARGGGLGYQRTGALASEEAAGAGPGAGTGAGPGLFFLGEGWRKSKRAPMGKWSL